MKETEKKTCINKHIITVHLDKAKTSSISEQQQRLNKMRFVIEWFKSNCSQQIRTDARFEIGVWINI